MTRWARANNVHKHKSMDATSWTELTAAAESSSSQDTHSRNSASDGLQHTQLHPGRKCSKKKSNLDGNVLMNYLTQTGKRLTHKEPQQRSSVHSEVVKVLSTALKDKRREVRRVKRQTVKKKNMLCFNCRKPGHRLNDCPQADNDEEMGSGICYRCGSTEHEVQRCRAKVDPTVGDYPYARCFLCGQSGHLSGSCPDNPKGLYAAGGCCRVCGSVEHFQKDCPDNQNSAISITLSRISNQTSADQEDVTISMKHVLPKKTKVVVF